MTLVGKVKSILVDTLRLGATLAPLFSGALAFAQSGAASGGGGGHPYVADWVNLLNNEVRPLVAEVGQFYHPQLTVENFDRETSDIAKRTHVMDRVYESCDPKTFNNRKLRGREVAACYTGHGDKNYFLSLRLWPIDIRNSTSKKLTGLHEILRSLKLEGDKYEIVRRISIQSTDRLQMTNCILDLYLKAHFRSDLEKKMSSLVCERTGGSVAVKLCTEKIVSELQLQDEHLSQERALVLDACEKSYGSELLIEALTMVHAKDSEIEMQWMRNPGLFFQIEKFFDGFEFRASRH